MNEKRFSQFQIFSKEELGSVRTCYKQNTGETWFVLTDVCKVLGIGNPSDAFKRLDEYEKYTLDNIEGIAKDSRAQKINIINEAGLYDVIFTSRKPNAKAFKKWVTTEVLPSIREHGYYALNTGDEEDKKEIEALKKQIEELKYENEDLFNDYRNLYRKTMKAIQDTEVIMTKEGFIFAK